MYTVMDLLIQTCSRCFRPLADGARFCRHCGLAESVDELGERLGLGAVSAVYRRGNGVLKIARDARTNHLIRNEAEVLAQLGDARFGPFLPKVVSTTEIDGRAANVLAM